MHIGLALPLQAGQHAASMRARCALAVSVALALQLLAVSADAKEVTAASGQAKKFAAYQKLVGPASHAAMY